MKTGICWRFAGTNLSVYGSYIITFDDTRVHLLNALQKRRIVLVAYVQELVFKINFSLNYILTCLLPLYDSGAHSSEYSNFMNEQREST